MRRAVRNAIADLRARCQSPVTWVWALGLPVAWILVMALSAPRGSGERVHRVSMCLLAFIPMLLLSPMPWQLRWNRRSITPWYLALPAHGVFSAILGPILTALVILTIMPSEGFRVRFLEDVGAGSLVFWAVTLPMGWMQAHAACLKGQTEQARAKAMASAWMRHSAPFDPDLLARHLRSLAETAEAAPESTVEGILALAQLYRQWLSMSECPLVALSEERLLLESFSAALEKDHVQGLRPDGEVGFEWFWAPGPVAWKLPPFSLFSIVALMVSAEARHVSLLAQTEPRGLRLSIRGKLPHGFTDHPVFQGVTARLTQAFGPDSRPTFAASGTVSFLLPGVAR